ncbi:MAG: hypothetical protein ABIP55_17090 [Tepidisphaeraceae bacterium]
MRSPALWIAAFLSLASFAHGGSPIVSPAAAERVSEWKDRAARAVINLPGDFDAKKPTLLIIYACPNGNSVEQTLGAKLESGIDWHFDIQHVAAQVRKLRQVDRSRNVALACIEADKKSWPAWRKERPDNQKQIRAIVDELSRAVPGPVVRIALSGHSGGGSFLFGYLNSGDSIAENVERLAWIDATYAYDDADKHGDKLLAWLKGDAKRNLVVFAYDDREVKLSGKNIVSPTGGTYHRSHKMIDRINRDTKLIETKRGEFEAFSGMNGQVHFLIHSNSERRILHTVLVERNGLLEAMTLGTALEGGWDGKFWGERAYSYLVTPLGAKPQAASRATSRASGIPARPSNAMGGKAFLETIADLPPKAREAAIVQEVTRGNIPDFLRKFCTIRSGNANYEVMPDYLAIGSDDDFVRIPMTPQSAMAIAQAFGCALPTRKMVNDIYAQAEVKLEPRSMTERREAVRTFVEHNGIIESQRGGKGLGLLVAGHKKDVAISNRLKEKPNRVAIYGWHKPDGKPIQPLYVGHVDWYVDYSHGIRLVKDVVKIDGKDRAIEEVLKDATLCTLLSDEGPIDVSY